MIEVVEEAGHFVAIEPISSTFGVGSTQEAAVIDLYEALREITGALEASEGMLSANLQNRLDYLRSR